MPIRQYVHFPQDCQDATKRIDVLRLLIVFQLDLLLHIGSALVLDTCTNCRTAFADNWQHVYFSSSVNGLICRDCEGSFTDKRRLSKLAAKCLNDLKLISKAGETTLDEIEKVLIFHFTELLHHPPKMAKYFLATSKRAGVQ